MSITWQPIKSRLQNEILTASIAQEIEKMEIKTGGGKEAVNANEETRGKGEEGRRLTRTFNEAMMRRMCLVSKMIMTRVGVLPYITYTGMCRPTGS